MSCNTVCLAGGRDVIMRISVSIFGDDLYVLCLDGGAASFFLILY